MRDEPREVRLTVHGLDVDNQLVRADVFADKLRQFVNAVKRADAAENESSLFALVISEMKIGSAEAALRQKLVKQSRRPVSPLPAVASLAAAIQEGSTSFDGAPPRVIQSLMRVAERAGATHSHVEVDFGEAVIVRFDTYFERRAARAYEIASGAGSAKPRNFEGATVATFDGTIREVDSRGAIVRGKIILAVNGAELDCTFRRDDIDLIRIAFDRRSRIEGIAIYDGDAPLPVRIEVRTITPIEGSADLLGWAGALRAPKPKAKWSRNDG